MERLRVISALCAVFVSCTPKIWFSNLWIAKFDEAQAYVTSKLLHYHHTLFPAVRWHYYVEPLSINCVPRIDPTRCIPILSLLSSSIYNRVSERGILRQRRLTGGQNFSMEKWKSSSAGGEGGGGERGSRVLQCVGEWGSGFETRDGDYNGWENLVEIGHTSIDVWFPSIPLSCNGFLQCCFWFRYNEMNFHLFF